tara:strand:- start:89629 stop:90294 length:666 start_codon:yes stop_codon:yes gene_type:complete
MSHKIIKGILIAFLFASIAFCLWYLRDDFSIAKLSETVEQAGILAPVLFVIMYATATVFFLPGSVLTLTGGFLFGPVLGTIYNIIGAVLGATLAFWIARFLASDWVAKKTGKRLQWLLQGIATSGWRFVAVVRLIPAIPFNLLNYALGLTKIRTLPYMVASAVFMLPGCFAYTYLGHLGEAVLAQKEGIVIKILWGIALLVLVSLIPWGVKKFKIYKTMDF